MKRRFVSALFLTSAALILAIPLVGLMLPRDYQVVRELIIEAPAEEIFPYINNPQNRRAWSPFQGASTKTEFEGPEEGPGAIMHWSSPGSSGRIEIDLSEQAQLVEYQTYFDDGYPTSTSRFLFEPVGDGSSTRVVWDFFGKVPFHPLKRYYVLRIDDSTGGKHLKGLKNLKKVLEGPSPTTALS